MGLNCSRWGLTGGIASGKSSVATALQRRGALIVDTDRIAHTLTAPGGAAIPALAATFGSHTITAEGALDRQHMRTLVFADSSQRQRLEHILHPLIELEAERQATLAHANQPVVFDVPLLVETGRWRARVKRILVVDCPQELQRARIRQRNGWDEATIDRILAHQATRQQRRACADAVIVNDGDNMSALDASVGTLWDVWCNSVNPANVLL
ncbi:dephospho-CoA kinase [Leptothrix ochracea L12]|uniref:Dephospho-CoA kinase n=1 Tax=Leptothrix ochracea L12 TaxID=735332 RepID=I4Z5S0_9BURK|nr:dephospho-CoA kinase [Leptothrix ochracea]EIM31562.1 dephospho-CoA kinase [Leptothrix ochracea L12]